MISSQKTSEKVKCFHCGEDCEQELITHDDKAFCCVGCRLVYELITENGLTSYYQIERTPGSRVTENTSFAYLDNTTIREQLLEYESSTLNKITFTIPVIHCSACVYLLEKLHLLHPGVIRSEVNFLRKEVSIDYNPNTISLGGLAHLLQSIGYTPKVKFDNDPANKQARTDRDLALRIGVAGFCFGNVMLLSFPEYLGIEVSDENNLQSFFSWISLALSLPVFFFSGWVYIVSAFKSLQQKYLNLDVPIALGMFALLTRSSYEILSNVGAGYSDSLTGLIFFLLIGKWFQNRTYQFLSFERDYRSYFPLAVNVIVGKDIKSTPLEQIQPGQKILIRNNEIIPSDGRLTTETALVDYSFVTGESEEVTKNKNDKVFAGGRVIGGSIEMISTKEVSQSYLTRLWNKENFKEEATPFKSLADKISKHFTLTVLCIALLSAGYWWFNDPILTWEVFTAVLIVACPCALALASPFTLGTALRIMGRGSLFLKNTSIVEKMAQVDTLVFDKTGTLTLPDAYDIYFSGELKEREKIYLAALTKQSTHPLSQKIFNYLALEPKTQLTDFEEIIGSGIQAKIHDHDLRLGSSSFITSAEGEVSENRIYFSMDDEVKGYFLIKSSYRSGLRKIIDKLKTSFRLHLLTGDHSRSEIERFKKDFEDDLTLKFDQGPSEKMKFIASLKEAGNNVLMIGDGLNDSGALKKADVGIAVTDDTSFFTPASDGILKGSSLRLLPQFLGLASASKKIVIASFILSFMYNVVGLGFAISGQLTPLTRSHSNAFK